MLNVILALIAFLIVPTLFLLFIIKYEWTDINTPLKNFRGLTDSDIVKTCADVLLIYCVGVILGLAVVIVIGATYRIFATFGFFYPILTAFFITTWILGIIVAIQYIIKGEK